MGTKPSTHIVFIDDLGNEEQRDVVNGHIVPIRLFDRNAFYADVFGGVERAIAGGLTRGALAPELDNPFQRWTLV